MTVPLRRNRDFMFLWSGLAVSVAGSRISQVGYPLLVLALTHSSADAGLVGFLGTIPYLPGVRGCITRQTLVATEM